MQLMARTWPKFLTLSSMGDSYEGRELWVMTINNPDTGPELSKAGMFIEANVHGNEIQGGEICLYTIWYLMENYDRNPEIKKLVDERVFYIVPTVNPDGRDYFLHGTGSGARTGPRAGGRRRGRPVRRGRRRRPERERNHRTDPEVRSGRGDPPDQLCRPPSHGGRAAG